MSVWAGTVQGEAAGMFPQYSYWRPVPWDMKCLEWGDGRVLNDRPFPRWTKLDTPRVMKVNLLDWEIRWGNYDRREGRHPFGFWLKAGPHTWAKIDFLVLDGTVVPGLFPRGDIEDWILGLVFKSGFKKVQEEATKRA